MVPSLFFLNKFISQNTAQAILNLNLQDSDLNFRWAHLSREVHGLKSVPKCQQTKWRPMDCHQRQYATTSPPVSNEISRESEWYQGSNTQGKALCRKKALSSQQVREGRARLMFFSGYWKLNLFLWGECDLEWSKELCGGWQKCSWVHTSAFRMRPVYSACNR